MKHCISSEDQQTLEKGSGFSKNLMRTPIGLIKKCNIEHCIFDILSVAHKLHHKTVTMKQIFRISFIFLGTLCLRSSAFARMPKPFLYMRTTINLGDKVSPNADVDDSLFDAEEAAAVDSHDLSDPGFEGAAMERAVMLAEEYKEQRLKKKKEMERRRSSAALIKSLDEQHDKGRKATFLSDDESLLEAEDAAAVDSHDLSDPGLEGAAMERAVMLAEEYKEQKKDIKRSSSEPCVGGAALIRSLDEQNDKVRATNLSTDDESLLDAEEAAAIDAHDVNDSGLEAAAMERAVMLAEEYKAQQMRKNEKKRTERMKSIEDHYKQVKKDIEAIERLIKEADDADHASVRRSVLVSCAFDCLHHSNTRFRYYFRVIR